MFSKSFLPPGKVLVRPCIWKIYWCAMRCVAPVVRSNGEVGAGCSGPGAGWQMTSRRRRRFEGGYSLTAFNLKALEMTLTDDRDMSTPAIAGDSRRPKAGNRTHAAKGTPRPL